MVPGHRTGPQTEGLFFGRNKMWKIVVGFALFATLALYILSKGGDIDMGGEKHGEQAPVAAEVEKPAPAATASEAK